MARYKKDHKEETRARMLAEARRLLIQGGADAVAITPLMSALQMTHGGFYAHFQSREELLELAALGLCREGTDAFRAMLSSMTPREAVTAYITGYLSAKHRDAKNAACPVAFLSGDIHRMSNRTKRSYQESYRALVSAIAEALDNIGIAMPEAAAASLLAELVGAINIARALGRSKASTETLERSRLALLDRFGRMQQATGEVLKRPALRLRHAAEDA